MTVEDIMWKLLDDVLTGKTSEDRARHILAGSGKLAEFDHLLKEFKKCLNEKQK